MAAHARLKNEFTEDEKCHNLMSWLIRLLFIRLTRLCKIEASSVHMHSHYMSIVTRKPVFVVCDQDRLKPVCSAEEGSYSLEIANIDTKDIILPRQRTTNVLIRLRGCASWSAPLLFAYGINRFSHDVDHIEIAKLVIPLYIFSIRRDFMQSKNTKIN